VAVVVDGMERHERMNEPILVVDFEFIYLTAVFLKKDLKCWHLDGAACSNSKYPLKLKATQIKSWLLLSLNSVLNSTTITTTQGKIYIFMEIPSRESVKDGAEKKALCWLCNE
jgi:hypothetical protein